MKFVATMTTYSLYVFVLIWCKTRACLDIHKADILEGIEGKAQSIHNRLFYLDQ